MSAARELDGPVPYEVVELAPVAAPSLDRVLRNLGPWRALVVDGDGVLVETVRWDGERVVK